MTVREVVVHRDARAPLTLSPRALARRYMLRRALSIVALMAMDIGSIAIAAILCGKLLHHPFGSGLGGPATDELAMMALATVAVFCANGLYGRRQARHSKARIVRAALITLVVATTLVALFGGADLARPTAIAIWGLAAVATLCLRSLYDAALGRVYSDADIIPVVLLGSPRACRRVRRVLAKAPAGDAHQRIIGMVGNKPVPTDWQRDNDLVSLGVIDDLDSIILREQPAEIVVTDPELARTHMPALVELCRRHRITLKLTDVNLDFGPAPVCFVPGFGVPLFVVKPHALAGLDFYLKRAVDFGASALLTVILSPVLLAIAIAIRLDSPGAVLFVDRRIGVGQRTFDCFKFRTMRRDAAEMQDQMEELNEAGGAIFKIRDDPRVTRVGKFLRRTSLDELPQLFNVLGGDMSLVGPRPLPLRDFRLLEDVHKQRHVVLPGMTGLWQVSGRSDLSFDEMIALDFRYIETWSLGTDFVILLKTVGAVFGVTGAY